MQAGEGYDVFTEEQVEILEGAFIKSNILPPTFSTSKIIADEFGLPKNPIQVRIIFT